MDLGDLRGRERLWSAITKGRLFPVLHGMVADRLVPEIILFRQPPTYALVVYGLEGEAIRSEVEIPIDWRDLAEREKLVVLELWVTQLVAASQRRKHALNEGLVKVGRPTIA